LEKCQNKLIKKKLQESYVAIKKIFVKKYKKLSAVEPNQSIKNLSLRESYAPPLNTTLYNPIIKSNRNPTKNLQQTNNCQPTQPVQKPKPIKFHERTKEPSIKKRQQLIDSLNLTKPRFRTRVRT
jgi:hypothetical protein